MALFPDRLIRVIIARARNTYWLSHRTFQWTPVLDGHRPTCLLSPVMSLPVYWSCSKHENDLLKAKSPKGKVKSSLKKEEKKGKKHENNWSVKRPAEIVWSSIPLVGSLRRRWLATSLGVFTTSHRLKGTLAWYSRFSSVMWSKLKIVIVQ